MQILLIAHIFVEDELKTWEGKMLLLTCQKQSQNMWEEYSLFNS